MGAARVVGRSDAQQPTGVRHSSPSEGCARPKRHARRRREWERHVSLGDRKGGQSHVLNHSMAAPRCR